MDDRIKQMVEGNLGLVGDCIKKIAIFPEEVKDMFSIGTIGLIKAAQSFDESKKIKFATYACRCINNEIFMEFRRKKRYSKDVSIETPIKEQEGEKLVLGDLIEDKKANIEAAFCDNEAFEEVMDIIINYLSPRERYIALSYAAGITQREICEEMNISQSYVSRIITKASKRVRARMNFPTYEKNSGKYNIKVISDKLFISFYGTQEKIESRIYEIDFPDYIPVFEITYDNEKACISLPAELDSMHFIAKVLNALEELP